jgi:hypothetical protein
MRKVITRQVPVDKILRPLLVGGLILNTVGIAAAQQSVHNTASSVAQRALSKGSPGCVIIPEAIDRNRRMQQQQPAQRCRTVGCVSRCN